MPTLFRKRLNSAVVVRPRVMVPALPAARPMTSAVATALRDRGVLTFTGTVTGWTCQPGQSYAALTIDAPVVSQPMQTTGMAAVTLNLDREAARYLPPNARVRFAIQVIGEDEDDGCRDRV